MKAYILAARPKTLPAALVPVWVGCALAYYLTGNWDLKLAIYTLMGAVWIQIATNFFNDAIDSEKGADTAARLGPVRASASGQLPIRTVYISAFLCLWIASVFGGLLFFERGWPILAIGIPSLYLCYGYTGGPLPLAYKGLGELFVIIFFGIVAVSGTFYVQTGYWSLMTVFVGLGIGCLSAVLISINNLRDLEEDRSNGKNTLAVKWGRERVLPLLSIMGVLPYLLVIFVFPHHWDLLSLLPIFILGRLIDRKVRNTPPSKIYNRFLAFSAIQLLLYAVAIQVIILL